MSDDEESRPHTSVDGWRNKSVLKVDIHRTNRETPGEDARNHFRGIITGVTGIKREQV